MGAKGMNPALFDAEAFAVAARGYVRDGDDSGLRSYPDTCLERTWRYHEYADWMSGLLFSPSGERATADPYGARLARARLARFADATSTAARAWGELMTGLA
jgi:p-hydroxybenzoate 3-monooxygenase